VRASDPPSRRDSQEDGRTGRFFGFRKSRTGDPPFQRRTARAPFNPIQLSDFRLPVISLGVPEAWMMLYSVLTVSYQHRPSRALGQRRPFCFIEASFTRDRNDRAPALFLSTDVYCLRVLRGDTVGEACPPTRFVCCALLPWIPSCPRSVEPKDAPQSNRYLNRCQGISPEPRETVNRL
jgi:hypothetical protein